MLSILFRGRSGGGVVLGVTLLALGLGLTVWSFQSAAPGGTYVIFVGLILGGCARIVTAALSPSPGRRYTTHAGPAQVAVGAGVSRPFRAPDGYCWQCGAWVRRGNAVCLACGATQPTVPDAQEQRPLYSTGAPVARPLARPAAHPAAVPATHAPGTPPQRIPSPYEPPQPPQPFYTPPQPQAPAAPRGSFPMYMPAGWDEPVDLVDPLEREESLPLPPPELPPMSLEPRDEESRDDANRRAASFE